MGSTLGQASYQNESLHLAYASCPIQLYLLGLPAIALESFDSRAERYRESGGLLVAGVLHLRYPLPVPGRLVQIREGSYYLCLVRTNESLVRHAPYFILCLVQMRVFLSFGWESVVTRGDR